METNVQPSLEDRPGNQNQLTQAANCSCDLGTGIFCIGVLLIILAPVFFSVLKPDDCSYCYGKLYTKCAISLALVVSGVVCFILAGRSWQRASRYKDELHRLAGLYTAIELAKGLPGDDLDETIKDNGQQKTIKKVSARTRTLEQIVQTLLNRYSG